MSEYFYNTGQLRFWNEDEINMREYLITLISSRIIKEFSLMNNAWTFQRVEGPIITPNEKMSAEYGKDDVWGLSENYSLRAETTPSTYEYCKHLQKDGKVKPPFCLWQVGKSFRTETNDGASWANLRAFEFYQMEFQCIYSVGTKADYIQLIENKIMPLFEEIFQLDCRMIESDRLPHYSQKTMDIEIEWDDKWREVCSVSLRTDYDDDLINLEIAFGLDRLVEIILGG